jgi:predicted component of type VI protein secretion system
MNLEKDSQRGADAQFILGHKLYKEAWNATADALTQQRRKVALKDTDMHTRLIMAEQVLDSVRRHIEDAMNTGRMAEIQLKQSGSMRRWVKIG